MPKYQVKPEDMGNVGVPVESSTKDKKHYPTVYFPVNKAIVKSLEVGQDVTVTLKGKVQMLEDRQDQHSSKQECRIEVHEVEAYSKDEYEELSEDESEDD